MKILGHTAKPLPKKLSSEMRNWRTIAEVLYNNPNILASLVVSMIAYETEHANREMVIQRLAAKLISIKTTNLKVQLIEDLYGE